MVYVRDGEAVMIGGILSEVQGATETKVPWLGDIPILGWAFKGTGDTRAQDQPARRADAARSCAAPTTSSASPSRAASASATRRATR